MPITISDKRKVEIHAAVNGTMDDLRLALVQHGLMQMFDKTDALILRAVPRIIAAVLAAAEGREQP